MTLTLYQDFFFLVDDDDEDLSCVCLRIVDGEIFLIFEDFLLLSKDALLLIADSLLVVLVDDDSSIAIGLTFNEGRSSKLARITGSLLFRL